MTGKENIGDEISLSEQWRMVLSDDNGGLRVDIYNPDPENPAIRRFFSVSTDSNKNGQPFIEQEPSLGVDLSNTENPLLDGERLVGVIVVADGEVKDRFSLSNLRCIQKKSFFYDTESGIFYVDGQYKGGTVCFLSPDKNRLKGLVAVISPEEGSLKPLKQARVLEMQDLAVLAFEHLRT
jgi:hypothetical protein